MLVAQLSLLYGVCFKDESIRLLRIKTEFVSKGSLENKKNIKKIRSEGRGVQENYGLYPFFVTFFVLKAPLSIRFCIYYKISISGLITGVIML